MAKIPLHQRRNPQSPQVKAWHSYRERKGRPKAKAGLSRGTRLTPIRFMELTYAYTREITAHNSKNLRVALEKIRLLLNLIRISKDTEVIRAAKQATDDLRAESNVTIQHFGTGQRFASEIIQDFKRTKGLRVFGFGVGYGQLLFFLKNFMGAKVKGVDLATAPEPFTKAKGLGVIHGKSGADISLRNLGKFKVTYSSELFDLAIIDRPTAVKILKMLQK